MGRTARDNRDRPHPRPVEKIQLPEGNVGRRLIAAAILLLIGGGALAYAFTQLMTPESGWRAMEASTSQGPNCGGELVFLYELGAGGASPAAENRAISALYSDACRTLFQLFHTVESFEGVTNLRDLSLHPNETLTVDGMLYRALETVQRSGNRTIYLGPVYARYGDLFFCQDDAQLTDFDPRISGDVAREYETLAAWARDRSAIDLRMLGDNQVCLYVSEDYLAFARREGVERFLDFGWLKNAFVVDALAELMIENGFTHGTISSYDGFQRNLDSRETDYSLSVLDYVDGVVCPAAVLNYRGPRSVVCLQDYAMDDLDWQRIYRLENGETRTTYLSPEDGLCRSAAHSLIAYSDQMGCGEIALGLAPVYVAEELEPGALDGLAREGIQSIYCRDRVIYATEPGVTLTKLYEGDGVRYTLARN